MPLYTTVCPCHGEHGERNGPLQTGASMPENHANGRPGASPVVTKAPAMTLSYVSGENGAASEGLNTMPSQTTYATANGAENRRVGLVGLVAEMLLAFLF